MLTAANVWRQLAIELQQTAADYASIVAGISWQGPSAMAMTLSTIPYVGWMHTTAAQAAQMSMAATTMASSFAATEAAVVHPSVVTANRTWLAHLLATNFFGINFPAIAATEAQYMQMWADNATAMLGYHASRLQTMTLKPFTPPPATTNPTGMAAKSAAVTTAQAINLPTSIRLSKIPRSRYLVHEESVIQSGFPFNLIGSFTGGHDFIPGQYPGLAPTAPHPRPLPTTSPVPRPWEAVPNLPPPPLRPVRCRLLSPLPWATELRRQPCGSAFGGHSPIQLTAAEAPLVATSAEGAH